MGDKNFRLSHDALPERYVFHVVPDLAARRFTASGHIELRLGRPARSLTLHGVALDVSRAELEAGGRALAASVTSDATSQTLTLTLPEEIAAGPARLALAWSGILHADLRGLYLAGDIGVTQFEAADARRVFPCFDEPAFKAVWELSVEADADQAVISNGRIVEETALGPGPRGARRKVRFAPTPRMSSYLVALVVGKLVFSPEVMARKVPIRTWAVPERAHLCAFAQECAAAVLPLLEDYFGTEYVFGKLDQVGIPDFEAGAMENAGCITFREVALLVDPEKAPLGVQKRVAEVITHELAHQWFGNLVTMSWWDDLWLNEAFATWMAYKIVDQWRPRWRMWDDFDGGKAAALRLDALASTHPIRSVVRNADEATENFDVITYEKGGALLRMLEGYLGEAAFRDGIRAYMRDHAYGNTVADDLWNALGRTSGQPIQAVASAWMDKEGFPLVTVERRGTTLVLEQQRFYAEPEKLRAAAGSGETWPVPVVVRWADDAGEHEARLLLGERRGELSLPARGEVRFVCANRDGAGFYRVRYQAEDLARLGRHGRELSPVERVNLLGDAYALFRAQAAPLGPLLDLLWAFAGDEDYKVVGEVVSYLDLLEQRLVGGEDRDTIRREVARLFAPRLAQLGWDPAPGEDDDRRLLRAAVVRALTLIARVPAAVDEARRRLGEFWSGQTGRLDPNLLDAASVAAARAGDGAHFERLLGLVAGEADPAAKRRYLVSLASFEAAPLVARALALSTSDTVPMQDISTYLGALLANRAACDAAWDDLRQRWGEIHKKAAAPMLLRRVVESMGELTHRRAEVEAFLDAQAEALRAVPQAIKQTRERMRLAEEVERRARPEVAAWLKARGL